MWFKAIGGYLTAVFSYGGSSATLITGAVSALAVIGIRCTEMADRFQEAIDVTDLTNITLIELGFFFFYSMFTFVNLATGLQAAKHEQKQSCQKGSFIKVEKLWKTIWKSLGMLLLTLMVCFLAIMISYMGFRTMYWAAIWFLIAFWLLANSYEFYSIGDNIKRRHGYKPRFFAFWDKVIAVFEKKIINKIDEASFPKEPENEKR